MNILDTELVDVEYLQDLEVFCDVIKTIEELRKEAVNIHSLFRNI